MLWSPRSQQKGDSLYSLLDHRQWHCDLLAKEPHRRRGDRHSDLTVQDPAAQAESGGPVEPKDNGGCVESAVDLPWRLPSSTDPAPHIGRTVAANFPIRVFRMERAVEVKHPSIIDRSDNQLKFGLDKS